MSMRLFANMLAGSIIVSLLYQVTTVAMSSISLPINLLGMVLGPFFRIYFDLFAAVIQSAVFVSLTIIYIAQEIPLKSGKQGG